MPHSRTANRTSGFTLIEVLVIAPMVILMIGAFIGMAVTVTGESLKLREKNSIAYDVQNAFDIIEDDAYRATFFPRIVSPLDGYDTNSTSYNMAQGTKTLLIKGAATSTNPLSTAKRLVYVVPSATNCGTVTNIESYPYLPVAYIYFVDTNGSLWRRTAVGTTPSGSKTCVQPWQRSSCASGCTAKDARLIDNVTSFDVTFFNNPGDESSAPFTWTDESPTTASIDINVNRPISGDTVSYGGTLQVSSINIK